MLLTSLLLAFGLAAPTATPASLHSASPAFLLPAAIAALPQQDGPAQEEIALRSARNAVAMGDFDLAIERFEDLLKEFPRSIDARMEYAGALVSAKRFREAQQQYEQLIRQYPDSPRFRVALADIFLQLKKFKDAADELEIALQSDPGDVAAAVKLARVHAWSNDFDAAAEVYRNYLRQLDPTNPQVQALLAPLLMDTRRPDEALPLLKGLVDADPENLSLLVDLARCHTMLGDYVEALNVIEDCKEITPEDAQTRLTLAQFLRDAGNFRAAIKLHEQILDHDPNNQEAKLSNARLHIAGFMPTQAMQILSDDDIDRDTDAYLHIQALHHALQGEYAHAREVYHKLLANNPDASELRLELGQLLAEAGEFQAAKAEMRKIDPNSALGRDAALQIAHTLASERRYDDSNAHCRSLMNRGNDHRPLVLYLRNLMGRGDTREAETMAAQYLREETTDTYGSLEIRTVLAEALLADGQSLRAKNLFEEVLADPTGAQIAAAHYGRIKALSRLADEEQNEVLLMHQGLSSRGGDFRLLMRIGELANQNGDYELAASMFKQILSWDSGNLPALIRQAEVQASDWQTGIAASSQTSFEKALRLAPSSIRARMGLARILSNQRLFAESIDQYDIVLEHDPNYSVALREKARVLAWDQRTEEAEDIYWRLQHPDPRTEIVGPANPEHLQLDNVARSEVEASTRLEQKSKSYAHDLAFYSAIPVLQGLVAAEPSNQEARFDLAQAYSETGQTDKAIAEYTKLLELNPRHREATVAMEHNRQALNPKGFMRLSNLAQSARNENSALNSNFDKRRFTLGASIPWGNEDEYFEIAYHNDTLTSSETNDVDGNVLSLRAQKMPTISQGRWHRFLMHGQVNLESYTDNLDTTATWDFGMDITMTDQARFFARAFQENVIENQNSLMDGQVLYDAWDSGMDGSDPLGDGLSDFSFPAPEASGSPVSRVGVQAGGSFRPSRLLEFDANFLSASYSDGNSLTAMHAAGAYTLSLPPQELKVALLFDSLDFADATWDNYQQQIGFSRYFAPNGYSTFGVSLKWRHWLSRDMFRGALQTWYEASLTGLNDSDESYVQTHLKFHHDISSRMGIELDARMLNSAFYDATQFTFGLNSRF